MDLSVCIVSWNTKDVLRECLRSVYANSEHVDIQVIVSDNNSSDGSVEMIKAEFPSVIVILNEENIGFGRAMNKAISKASGTFILVLNPDIIITQRCFREMTKYLEKNELAGCVACKLVNGTGIVQKSHCRKFPSPLEGLLDGLMVRKVYERITLADECEKGAIEVAWAAGAAIMMRGSLLKAMRGFDERYYMYGEDIDLCFRLAQRGWKIYYLADVVMTHHRAVSSRKQKRRYFAAVLQRESVYRFLMTHFGPAHALVYRFIWIASTVIRVVILGPAYLVCTMVAKEGCLAMPLEKSIRILSWGLGRERWTTERIPG